MNPTHEQIYEYANQISSKQQQQGFGLPQIHNYTDEQGNFIYAKIRLKNPNTCEKWIRAISLDNNGNWQMKESNFEALYPVGKGLKPIYLLDKITSSDKPIFIFEGEQKADLATKLGFVATTAGGSSAVNAHDWQPLMGKSVILWQDNDEAGKKWLTSLLEKLVNLPCDDISIIDISQLNLPNKGDIVDFVDALSADGKDDSTIVEKIKNLPTLTDGQVLDLLPNTAIISVSQNPISQSAIEYENGFIESFSDGLYFIKYDDEGNIKSKSFICTSITILARTRDINNQNWGIWCEWHDREGVKHDVTLPMSLLQGDSREYRQQLASHGLVIATSAKARACLDAFLNFYPTETIALCVDTVGWHGEQYVLPNHVFGEGEAIIYQSQVHQKTHYQQQGALAEWQLNICQKIANQSKIVFAISAAFAGQLLPLVNENGGGFHFVGSSTKGKSLTAKLACSVWGHPKTYIHSWRATINSQENIASQHNHGFIALDEINLANPNTVGEVVYMLADGEGKDRMSKTGQNRPTLRWQVMYLSTGEETLESIQNRSGKPTKAGQEVRFVSVDAVTDDYLGIFDSLMQGYNSPAEQADALSVASSKNFGSAGIAWLEHITQDKQATTDKSLQLINEFLSSYPNLSSQARRVCRLFAVVASAGELATQAEITGWEKGHATACSKKCFENWLSNFAHDGDYEEYQILSRIRAFIQQHGESRFANWGSDKFVQKVSNRVGFIREHNYLFFKEGFKEASQPFSVKTVVKVLKKHQLLRINELDRDTYKINERGGNKNGRYYYVLGEILSIDIDSGINGKTGRTIDVAGTHTLPYGSNENCGLGSEDKLASRGNIDFPTIPNHSDDTDLSQAVDNSTDFPTSHDSQLQSLFAPRPTPDWVFDS